MAKDIKKHDKQLQTMPRTTASTAKKPPELTPIANTVPMQHVGTDLFYIDEEDNLVLVDRYSGFLVSKPLHSTNTTAITNQLKAWFDLLGWPQSIRSDRGPQYYRTEFDKFCNKHNIKHEPTSPHNGLAVEER